MAKHLQAKYYEVRSIVDIAKANMKWCPFETVFVLGHRKYVY